MFTNIAAAGVVALSLAPTASTDVLVSYARSGGFAGVEETVVVHRDGKVAATAGGTAEFTLDGAEVRAIRRALDGVTTRTSSHRWCDIADRFSYTLAYRDWRATRCHQVPDDWRPAVTRLDTLLRSSTRGGT